YYSNALTDSADSLASNANMISKVYFPRLILPMAADVSKLLDFAIASVLLAVMMVWFGIVPSVCVLVLPWLIVLTVVTAAGDGTWATALAIQYRDIKHAMGCVVRSLMYAAPVVYSVQMIPEVYRPYYALSPMVGVIEGFRAALLGTQPMPWMLVGISSASAL